MPKHYITPETKQHILDRVKQGIGVPQLAADHGVSTKTIYGWLRKQAEGNNGSLSEMGRLKRQNKMLLELVGKLTLKLTLGEKINTN